MKLSNQVYDKLKFLVQVVLPAVATLYFALAGIWGLPNAEQVIGTIAAITTFLGVVLGISTSNYNRDQTGSYDGNFVVTEDEDGMSFLLQLEREPDDLADKSQVLLRVVRQ